MCPAQHRKRLLLAFAALGSVSAMLFLLIPSSSPAWPLVAPLAICANVGFGASIVALNAYIPFLARGAREVVIARTALEQSVDQAGATRPDPERAVDARDGDLYSAEDPLLPQSVPAINIDVLAAKIVHDNAVSSATARISAQGIALGYAAGIVMLLLALVPVRSLGGSTFSLRLAVGLSGAWWAFFSIPAAFWLPGASAIGAGLSHIRSEENGDVRPEKWSTRREIVKAWKRLGGMLRWREIRKLGNTFIYLAAWFLLSDGECRFVISSAVFVPLTERTHQDLRPSRRLPFCSERRLYICHPRP